MEPGQIHMIDVTEKEETEREAVATGLVKMKPSTLESIRRGEMAKGAPAGKCWQSFSRKDPAEGGVVPEAEGHFIKRDLREGNWAHGPPT